MANEQGEQSVIRALRRAARQGNGSAAFILGRLFAEGWGVPASAPRAFKWYQFSAEAGFLDALYFVGFAYYAGEGVRSNPKRALDYFARASSAGDLVGEYMYAMCVLEGVGTRSKRKTGLALMRRAARRGSCAAMDYLAAWHLRSGRLQAAKRWASKAVRAGDQVAVLRLNEIDTAVARRRARVRASRSTH